MESTFDEAWRAAADLSEISDWAGKLICLKDGDTCKVTSYEIDGERHENRTELEDGLIFYADLQDSIVEAYDWKVPERLLEEGEQPLTIALIVAADLAELVILNLIRRIDSLPEDCVWRDRMRHDLRMQFIEGHPRRDSFFLEGETLASVTRDFLTTINAIDDAFGLKLMGLCLLEKDLAKEAGSTALLPQDYDLLRAMRVLGAEKCPKPALEIMQAAGRNGWGKRAFLRVQAAGMVRSSSSGFFLTPLGLSTINDYDAAVPGLALDQAKPYFARI